MEAQIEQPTHAFSTGWVLVSISTHLSASSRTNTSNSLTLTVARPFPSKNSSIRPGVPMTMSAAVDRKRSMSCSGDDCCEETNKRAGGSEGFDSSLSEFGWADRKVEKTE